MRKIYCDACGIMLPKSVLQKNPSTYWSKFLDLCPTCNVISIDKKYYCKFKKLIEDLEILLDEVKNIKETAKCECDLISEKPLKVIVDI